MYLFHMTLKNSCQILTHTKVTRVPLVVIFMSGVILDQVHRLCTKSIEKAQQAEEVGHACAPLILITYFYLEFHVTLNGHNTKPANIGAHWGSLALRLSFKKIYLVLKEPLIGTRKSVFSSFHQEIQGLVQNKVHSLVVYVKHYLNIH